MSKLILFNKPFNVLCQFTDSEERKNLSDYIFIKKIYPCGRLDKDSEGLLLLTDDGQLQHHFSHPKNKQKKYYYAQVEGIPSHNDLNKLRAGITLRDGPCQKAIVKQIPDPKLWPRTPPIRFRKNNPTSWLEIIITEGRNRQVRRMTAAIGYPTLRLIRHRIGTHALEHLKPGEFAEHKYE